MAGNNSFTLQGATPNKLSLGGTPRPISTGGNPYSSALSNAQNGIVKPPAPVAPPAPTNQQVASHSITHPDGTTVTQKYVQPKTDTGTTSGMIKPSDVHPPGTSGNLGDTTTPPQDASGNGNTPGAPGYINPNASIQGVGGTPTIGGTNTTYQGLIGGAANAAGQNASIGQSAADIAKQYGAQIAQVGQQGANAQAGYKTTGTSPVAEGNAAVINQNTSAQEQALAAGESAALAGTGQQLTAANQQAGALTSAAGTIPDALRYGTAPANGTAGNTGNSLLGKSATGQPIVDNSVENALGKILSGATVADATANLVGGPVALTAFDNAMKTYDPNYNPTASTAIAQQNMKQAQGFQQEAATLNTTLSQMDNAVAPTLSLIKGAKFNQSDAPSINSLINSTSSNIINPAGQAILKQGVQELKSYTAALLGSDPSLTPTAVTAAVNSFDPANFTPKQFSEFYNAIRNYGQARIAPLQQSSTASYGGKSGYTGPQANPTSSSIIPANSTASGLLTSNPSGNAGLAIAGGAIQSGADIMGLITKLAGVI